MLEYARFRGACYVVGFPEQAQKDLPEWVGITSEIRETPSWSNHPFRRRPLLFSSRESMSQRNRKLLSDVVLARQRGHTLIIITQDCSYIDKNVSGSIDTLIIKEPAPLQAKMGRPEIRAYLEEAAQVFSEIDQDRRPFCYIAFSLLGFTGLIRVP